MEWVNLSAPEIKIDNAAWAVRNIGSSVSAVVLDGDHTIAGSHEGLVTRWNGDGDELWSITFIDRINRIVPSNTHVFLALGLSIACLESQSGELLWMVELEGLSDHIVPRPDGSVIATSAVWDIEYGDYMEAGIWHISPAGEVLEVHTISERMWDVSTLGDDVFFSLARPRCGVLVWEGGMGDISSAGFNHIEAGNSPGTTLCPSAATMYLGTSGGKLHLLPTNEEVELVDSMIISLVQISGHIIAVDEHGSLYSINGEMMTSLELPTHGAMLGPRIYSKNTIVLSHPGGKITIVNEVGEIISFLSCSEDIESLFSSGKRMVVGGSHGAVLIIESTMLERRISSNKEARQPDGDVQRREMMRAKLRSLREKSN